ncbi:beta-ketoacyl-ACP synthase I [Candidatus Riesia pediculicola]|uniref:3-oxoacyl-[acyl-carrier-protein] synthase 1 n=1 Tax=Riesia pediculicola (strain USDA) TaxID=515618 RepID=D4G8T0_RIEPU|nr:beta-ketoacyl-ACP synthase I [Candidatus Riesia pediculicola]ADD79936.1 3-oxoacyl-[acyl-carrier-protein] synthase 1 [Candidatus Riesia pediculicola USDA]QOJ86576.1 beta-ketoacyl-ACP synthase I [Candidatus Riesia pediculicola]
MRRAVITGIGIISSIGNNQKEVLHSLRFGKSGIQFSEEFKSAGLRSCVWGGIKIDRQKIRKKIHRKVLRFMSDCSIYTYLAMQEAILDSQLSHDQISHIRTGIVVGSGGGSPYHQVAGSDIMRKRGLRGIGPYMVTKAMASGISACLAVPFKIKGVNYSISSACSTSAHCVGHALELIQLNKQDIVFAGGGEELSWQLTCEFDAMGALSTKYNHIPEKASRPYDEGRDGFVISGGGGIVVVEELFHALSRGANIYAEITGYGATSDGYDMVSPSGEGAERCMKMALCNKKKGAIDYLNTHGTSTLIGDIKELDAIRKVFGKNNLPLISSTKSITGHSLGAAGVHEIIYSLIMLKYGFVSPSINIDELDKNAKDMNIVTEYFEKEMNSVMSNSFGFGGTNASILMEKYSFPTIDK